MSDSKPTPTTPLAPVTEAEMAKQAQLCAVLIQQYSSQPFGESGMTEVVSIIFETVSRISAAATAKGREAIEILKSFPEASIEEYPLSSRTGKYWPRLARWINTQRDPFINQQGKPHQPSEETK